MQAREGELAQEARGVLLEVTDEDARVEGHVGRPQQALAEADEGEDERDLEGVGEVVGQLDRHVVEAEERTRRGRTARSSRR